MTLESLAVRRPGAIKIGPFGSELRKQDMVSAGRKVYGQENVIAEDWSLGDRRVTETKFQSLRSCRLEPGDVVLTMMGTIGRCGIFPANAETGLMDSHLLRIQPDPATVDRTYLCMVVGAQRVVGRQVVQMSHGSIMSGLSSGIVRRLRIPVPPLAEQRCIAEIIGTLDKAIRETQRLIAKLEQMGHGIRQALLACGLDQDGALRDPIRHAEWFKGSQLGRIPNEWGVCRLADVSEFVTSGSRGWATYYADNGPLFVRIGNLTRDHINLRLDRLVHVIPPVSSEGRRTRLEAGDLLISITADLGIIGVVPQGLGEAFINQHIALVRVDPLKANSRWLGHYMAGYEAQRRIRRLDDPGAKAGLNLPAIRSLLAALPPRFEQDEIAARLDAADDAVAAERSHGRKLELLKDGLMECLLTGRVRIQHAGCGHTA